MIMLMSSFSSRIYGKRSAENKKARKLAKLAETMLPKEMDASCELASNSGEYADA
jgi:hypothetical protein